MDNIKNISNSILEILEYNKIVNMLAQQADTVMGKELAVQLTPDGDLAAVGERLQETQEATAIFEAAHDVSFGGIRDIREIIKRAGLGAVLEPRQLLAVFDTLCAARRLKNFFTSLPADFQAPVLKELSQNITILKNVENAVTGAIDDQAAVKDTASADLAKIRREIKQTQNRIKEKIDGMLRNPEFQKIFQESIVTIRRDRYVIPVKQEYRNNFPGIVHDQSASGATLFIEPMAVLNLNNDLSQLMIAEKNEIERILALISAQIAQSEQEIAENSSILARLDLIFAKAKLAAAMRAVKPIVSDKGYIKLIAARHPLIDSTQVVPIDVRLGMDFHVLLITGPNTGGKTVTLKTVGLFALMVKAGLFIPASPDSVMPVINNIFADIGDEQSIEQSLSTFSSHMTRITGILAQIAPGDLALLDEIGAGTDPDEGAALAMAIIEHLAALGAKVIATTHYSELKTFAYTRSGIENASVEFDIKTLSPTYRLLIGVPGGSNAFAISLRLGLKNSIVERAKEMINKEHADFEAVLAALEEQKRTYASNLSAIEQIKNDFKIRQEELKNEEKRLTEKKNSVIIKAKDEAEAIVRQARRETEEVIKKLKEQFAEKESRVRQHNIEAARRQLKNNLEKIGEFTDGQLGEETYDELLPDPGLIKPGMVVHVTALGRKGEVLSVSQDTVTVRFGAMKMNVPVENCRLSSQSGAENHLFPVLGKDAQSKNNIIKFGKTLSRQIDVRGLTIEEALLELDKYIDGAVLGGLNEILIIHGKGTGALRKGVKKYLENHPKVKENQIAETNEGGYGATVAKLL